MNGTTAYVLSKKYIQNVLVGVGALKGAPCEVQTVSKIDGVTTVTLKWTDTLGVDHTTSFDINDGVSVVNAKTNSSNHLIFELSDGTNIDCGEVAEKSKMLTGTLLASGWVGKTQVVSVDGLEGTENGVIGLANTATDEEIAAARLALITVKEVIGSNVTFNCEQVPSIDINFMILIPGSGGSTSLGGAEIENPLTAGITVGGISSGTSYAAGTKIEDILNDLLNPILLPSFTAPTATLTSAGSKILETGSSITDTFTATLDRGSITPAYGTTGYRSGAAVDYSLNGGTAQVTNTWTETVSDANKTFRAEISYAAGEQPKDSKGNDYDLPLAAGSVMSNTITYEFVDRMWANVTNISTVAKIAIISKSVKQRDLPFPEQTEIEPETFDIPKTWTVTDVLVKNDLSGAWDDAIDQFDVTTVSHNDAAGNSVDYNRYECNLGMDLGARTIRVKWN